VKIKVYTPPKNSLDPIPGEVLVIPAQWRDSKYTDVWFTCYDPDVPRRSRVLHPVAAGVQLAAYVLDDGDQTPQFFRLERNVRRDHVLGVMSQMFGNRDLAVRVTAACFGSTMQMLACPYESYWAVGGVDDCLNVQVRPYVGDCSLRSAEDVVTMRGWFDYFVRVNTLCLRDPAQRARRLQTIAACRAAFEARYGSWAPVS
jgi:hypothetical protein